MSSLRGTDLGKSMQAIILYSKFKDFKDHFQNSRTFQVSSKIVIEIQGYFKDFKDLFEIQGFFQGCGHPVDLACPDKWLQILSLFRYFSKHLSLAGVINLAGLI